MRRPAEAILIAVLTASACTSTSPLTGVPSQPTTRPAEPQVASSSPAPTSPVDTRPEARPSAPAAAILVDDDGSGIHLRARPIDPVTLEDVPGYSPISFGHHYVAAVAPRGGLIAAVLWPSGNANSGGTLHLIDTTRWSERVLALRIDTYTTPLHFDERGTAVFWAQPASSASDPTSAVWRLDVAAGSARQLARLPDGMSAREVMPFGDLVTVFAQPSDLAVGAQRGGSPSIFVIDPATGAAIRSIPVPVRAGQYQDPKAVDPTEPWRTITPGLAWDLPRSRLFVADAESERIYRVDLRTGAIANFDPQPRRSFIDTLWALLGGSIADAKSNAASRQQATISPDGERLYVSGSRTEYVQTQDGRYQEQITPLDLRVIETRDMSEVARHGASTGPLWIAPDGVSLLYGTARYDPNASGYAFSEFKLHLADGATAQDRAVVSLSGDVWIASVDSASRSAYVVSTSVVADALGRATVTAIDLQTGRARVARDMGRHYADVLLVAPR